MGSGISLSKKQLLMIIDRLTEEFEENEYNKPVVVDGYLVYYDYSDEVEYNKKLKELNFLLSLKQNIET